MQVDERAIVDLGRSTTRRRSAVTQLTYTDPGTFTGPTRTRRSTPTTRSRSWASTAGARARRARDRPASWPAAAHELQHHLTPSGTTPAYVYLFRQTGDLDPSAGRELRRLPTSACVSGDYKTTYGLQQRAQPRGLDGHDGRVHAATSPTAGLDDAHHHHRAGGASGADILDRHKNLFAPGNCGRSEDTFAAAEGAFIVNKSGPVRAIRCYVGANSGPLHPAPARLLRAARGHHDVPAGPRDRRASWTSSTTARRRRGMTYRNRPATRAASRSTGPRTRSPPAHCRGSPSTGRRVA